MLAVSFYLSESVVLASHADALRTRYDVRRDIATEILPSQSNGSLPKQLRCKILIVGNMNPFYASSIYSGRGVQVKNQRNLICHKKSTTTFVQTGNVLRSNTLKHCFVTKHFPVWTPCLIVLNRV